MTGVTVLDQGWELRGFLGDDWQLHRAQLHAREGAGHGGWSPARVPGSVLADLLAAGQVPDPYVGTQSLLSEWVPQRTWVYRTRLRPPALAPGERAFLEFDGIDYAAAVYLDGHLLATHEGTYVPLVVEVTGHLGDGEHTLAVVVEPAPVSEPQVGYTDKVRVHKGRMGYGWDFCPRLVHQGLWGQVRLRTTGPSRLAGVWARPAPGGRVTVELDVDGPDGTAECVLRAPDGSIAAKATVPRHGAVLQVDDPRPWHLNGTGRPDLYTLTTTLPTGDEHRLRLGFRDVRFTGDPGTLPYRLTVNGTPTAIKGWNWVPADALYGATGRAKLRHLLTLARDAGVNMLRVWGGGLIETEDFYDLCDEYGILVWQEFAQSSSGMRSLPSDDAAFVARMAAEAERIVPARRNHPSLAIWCGGNELQRADGVPLADADSPVLAALHEVVARLDPDRHWLPTSPSGPVFGNTLESVRTGPEHHDVHGPWEHQGLDDHYRLYDEGRALLLSEFGVEGMSNLRAIESVVPAAARRLPTHRDPVWNHLGRWWNNEPLVQEAFGGGIGDLATMSRASQLLQADGLRYAIEAGRRRSRSRGVLPWQLNESFPNGWCTAAVDYFGEPKAAYHYVRRAYRPMHVCAALGAPRVTDLDATVWAWWGPGAAQVSARVLRLDGGVVAERSWTAPAEGRIGELRRPGLTGLFLLDLSVRAGDRTASNRYLLTADAGFGDLLTLPPARVTTTLETTGPTWTLRLRHEEGPAAVFLRLLDARPAAEPGWVRWDDNAFDLLPGEERVVRGEWDGVPEDRRRVRIDGWNVSVETTTRQS
ncbi:glycoside hydrolase family 2 protein [Nonomuraea rubra]|uniref:beta-mannosidase n=1 Tax=Nonomuraea rubra TaxID=46180 RepID=A0A7X0P7Y6_9ACTN|nr:glycoside hydrolase family 2 TIM barrel-domain containing protein [Nonomuraea rubra]MBB6556732.1 beta-mannosidase [Nonomuraea rubra]